MFRSGRRALAILFVCLPWLCGAAAGDTVQSAEGQFIVEFPGSARFEQNPGKTSNGALTYQSYIWSVNDDTGSWTVFLTVHNGMPNNNPERMMEAALRAGRFTLRDSRLITVDGVFGLEYFGDRSDGLAARSRVFMRDRRAYQVIYVGRSGDELGAVVDAYMKSLHFTDR